MPNKYSYAHVLSQLESQGRLDPKHRSHSKYMESWYDSGPDSPGSGSIDTSSSSDHSAAPPSLSLSQSSPETDSLHSVESTDSRTADSIVTQIYAPEQPSTPPATEHAPIRSPPLRPFPNYTRRDSTPQYIGRSPGPSKPYSSSPSHPSPSRINIASSPSRPLLSIERTSLSPSTPHTPKKSYAESTFSEDSYFGTLPLTGTLTPSPSQSSKKNYAESTLTDDSWFAKFPLPGNLTPSKSSLKPSSASTYTNDSYFATASLPGTLTPLSQEFDSRVNPWDDLHHLPSTFRMHPPSDDASSDIAPSIDPSIAPSSNSRASTPDSAAPPPISRTRASDYPPPLQTSRPQTAPSSKDSTPTKPHHHHHHHHHRLPFLTKSSHHPSHKPSNPSTSTTTTVKPYPATTNTPSTTTFVASLPPGTSSSSSSKQWVASTFNVEGMSERELEKLRRRGINPALKAEMQAARKGRGGVLPVSVGNTFIG